MNATKLSRNLDTELRENLATIIVRRTENAADTAKQHAAYAGAAADAQDADMAREHAARASECHAEAEAACAYLQTIGAHAWSDTDYHRAMQAAEQAEAAAQHARMAYEAAAANDHARESALEKARKKQTRHSHERTADSADKPDMQNEADKRLVWLRALYLLRQEDRGGDILHRMAGYGIVPLEILDEADAILCGGFKKPGPLPHYGTRHFNDDDIPF